MYQIEEVFTHSSPSVSKRSVWAHRPLDERAFHRVMGTPGRQICVYGETGVGKTSLAMRLLREKNRPFIVYSCDRNTTATAVFEKTLDALRILKKGGVETEVSGNASVVGSLLAFFTAESKVSLAKKWKEETWTSTASKENVIDALLKTGMTLIVDDMEKIRDSDSKGILADCAKALSDRSGINPSAKMIFIGIANDASELLQLDTSIRSRLSLQRVTTMPTEVIAGDLLREGFNRLNLTCLNTDLKELAEACCGLPKIAHMLGFHIAEAVGPNVLWKQSINAEKKAEGIGAAIQEMSSEFQADYEMATRCNAKSQRLHKHILEAIAHANNIEVDNEYLSIELSDRLHRDVLRKHFATAVSELKKPIRASILQDGLTRGTHRFRSQLMRGYVYIRGMEEE